MIVVATTVIVVAAPRDMELHIVVVVFMREGEALIRETQLVSLFMRSWQVVIHSDRIS